MGNIVNTRQRAFTIVELLIVIVVIAILAAISIVAYNGIQSRARASAASSALAQAQKKILIAMNDGTLSAYPTNQAGFDALNIASSGVTYQYIVPSSSPAGYCITATVDNTSYKITETGQPTSGLCNGHGNGSAGTVTNIILNPSVETNTTGYSGPNGTTTTQSSARAHSGMRSILATLPTTSSIGTVGVHTTGSYVVGSQLSANTTYTYSAWVYVPSGTANLFVSGQGPGIASTTCNSSSVSSVKDSWVRFTCTLTTSASGGIAIYVLNNVATTSGMTFYLDSVMMVAGSTHYSYSDGNSPGWDWSSTVNNSTSSGPPL